MVVLNVVNDRHSVAALSNLLELLDKIGESCPDVEVGVHPSDVVSTVSAIKQRFPQCTVTAVWDSQAMGSVA